MIYLHQSYSLKSEEFKRLRKEATNKGLATVIDFLFIPGLLTIFVGRNKSRGVKFLIAWAVSLAVMLAGLFAGISVTALTRNATGSIVGLVLFIGGILAIFVIRIWLAILNYLDQMKAIKAMNAYFEKAPLEEKKHQRKVVFASVAIITAILVPVTVAMLFTVGVPEFMLFLDAVLVVYSAIAFVQFIRTK